MKLTSIGLILSLTSTLVSCIPLGLGDEGSFDLLERSELDGDEVTHWSRDLFSEGSADDVFARDYMEDYVELAARAPKGKDDKAKPAPKPAAKAAAKPATPKVPTPGRGPGGGGAAVGDALANLIIGIQNEPKLRGDFVKSLIDATTKAKPGFQAIACHSKHTYQFEGTRGKDWDHSHAEYQKDATPGTIGFEIYWFKKGWFQNQGDGGWQNWAYTGNPKKEGDKGKKLTYS